MKTLLLTGSGGFIGKNLKSYFKDSYILLTPRSFEFDLTNKEAVDAYFKKNSIDCIIHCASIGGARGIEDEERTIEANMAMVENLLSAKAKNCRMVLFGSGAMYGKDRPIQKLHEDTIGDYEPKDLYGQSKITISKKIKALSDVVCLNIFACYGYDEKESRFPSYAIMQNLKKEDIVINQNVIFDYLFVEDMQRIVAYFLENQPKNNIINITPTQAISLYEIAEIVNEISEHKSKIIIKNKELGNEYTGSNTRLLEEFQHIEFTEYHTGLEKLFYYIKERI